MQIITLLKKTAIGTAMLALGVLNIQAQTATWKGPASGGEWNTDANWDLLLTPGVATNAVIGAGTNLNYNLPMVAATFGALTNKGTLNVNTNGFNSGTVLLSASTDKNTIGAKLFVNNNGIMAVSGTISLCSNSIVTVSNGGSLTASGQLFVGSGPAGGASGGNTGSYGAVTNNGGTISVGSTAINGTGFAITSASKNCLLVINGGTNNLGSVTIKRNNTGSFGALGSDGLAIYNGIVTMAGLDVGNGTASHTSALIAGGIVTNNGSVLINQGTSTRGSRLNQTGGFFVVTNLVNPNPTVAGTLNIYSVTGGTNLVGGFAFGSGAGAGTVLFTNGATIYVGSQGITANGVVLLTAQLNSGSLMGALAPWTGSVAMNLAIGTETFQTADLAGSPNNITYNGALSGAGNLNITGGGTLTLGAANTYSGSTIISGGTLALGASGSLASSLIIVGSGTTFDVSALGGAYSPASGKTLGGLGNINGLVTATTCSIQPGSNSVTGTLTFSSGLTENGGVTNNFVLPGNKIACPVGLTASGANVVQISGAVSAGSEYTLFNYSGGSFAGSVANFTLAGVTGYLTNVVAENAIKLHATVSLRAPTNIVWVGNSIANNWDTITTNWLNAGALDDFLAGDTVLFSNQGGKNPLVNIGGTVKPFSVVVNTGSNYVFSGIGSISDNGAIPASITVSNGSLTIATINDYSGPTILAGGVLVISNIANGTVPSPIGAASVAAGNIVFNGGTLDYFGGTAATDHGITITNGGGVIDVISGTTLTLNGSIVGNGVLTKIDTGSLTLATANSYSGGTVVSNGTLTLNDVSSAGTGSIALYGGNLAIGAVKPANTINVAGNAQITGGNGSGNTAIKNVVGSSNLVLSVTTGVFDLTGDMSAYSGTISLANGGGATVRLNGSASNVGSPLATWNLGAGPMDLNIRVSSTSNNIGALQGGSSTTLTGRSGASSAGSTTFYIGANNLITTFDGVIQNGYGNSGSTPSSTAPTAINKVGSSTLTLTGVHTYTSTTTVSSGVLALTFNPTTSSDGSINNSATINVVSGAVLDVSGRSDSTLQLGATATQLLQGRGTINGNLNVGGSGKVSLGGGVGGSVGTLTVTSSITLGGTAVMKLNRGNSPNSDRLVSSLSSITYGGTLVVTNIGSPLKIGDTFTLFNGSGLNAATFSTIILPNYYGFDTSQLAVNGSITVTNVSALPALSSVDFSALTSGSITLNGTNGAVNGAVNILTSTNLALPLSSWTLNASTTFDGSGNLSNFTITVDPTVPQLFILLHGL